MIEEKMGLKIPLAKPIFSEEMPGGERLQV